MSTTAHRPIATAAQRTEPASWPTGQPGLTRRGEVFLPSQAGRPQPATAPQTAPVPVSAPLQRRKSQRLALTIIVCSAVFCVSMGILYLSGYASLQFELNRRIKLQGQLRAAQEKSRLYQQHMAQVNSNEYIEQEAQKAHMVLADDRQTISLEQTK